MSHPAESRERGSEAAAPLAVRKGAQPPAYPDLSDPLDRRRFLSACARAAVLAGTCLAIGGRTASGQDREDEIYLEGDVAPPDWPRGQIRLIDDEPFEVVFRDGRTGTVVVAVVIGAGPEPTVDRAALLRAVREACRGFDADCLRYDDARATLEAQLRARLDEMMKAWGSSVEAVSVVPVPREETSEDAGAGAERDAAPPRDEDSRQDDDREEAPATLPHPSRGRCLIHGDGPCPPHERRK